MSAAVMTQSTQQSEQLVALLGPIYAETQALARRIAGGAAQGDDLFQEATLRAMAKIGSLRDPASFRFWFYRILLSVHRTQHRRSFWRRAVSMEVEPAADDVVGDDGTWEEQRTSSARATAALATLPAEQREAVVLFEVEGFSLEEVAALQGSSLSAVKSRVTRGRERLRAYYERQDGGWWTRTFSGRPALLATVILALLVVGVPAGYAAIRRLLVAFDVADSEPTIQRDVERQLRSSGVPAPTVDVQRHGDTTAVTISDHGRPVPSADLDVRRAGAPATTHAIRIGVAPNVTLSPAELDALRAAIAHADPHRFERTAGMSDQAYADLFIRDARAHGYDVEVVFAGADVVLVIEGRIAPGATSP